MMKPATLGFAFGLVLGLPSASLANDFLATPQFSGSVVSFATQSSYANITLRVTGPNEYKASASFPSGTPQLDLSQFGAVLDGIYNYHITATTGETMLGSGRDEGRPTKTSSAYQLKSVSKSGSFTVKGGAIVSGGAVEPKRR